VIKVDTTAFEKSLYFFVVACSSIDGIFAKVVLVRSTSHGQGGVRHNSKCIRAGLN
jgi:hypothetical protein